MSIEELGFEPGLEQTIEESPRSAEELMLVSVKDLETMDADQLQRFHDELLPHLGRPDKPATGFSGFLEKLPDVVKKRIQKNPAVAREHLQSYLQTSLQTLRSRKKIEQNQAPKTIAREVTGADRRFTILAEERLEQNFTAWTNSREIIDSRGQLGRLYPEDATFVERIDNLRDIQRAKGEEFFELTDRFEVGFAQGLELYSTFGDEAAVEIHPSSKYDDYARGVDMIARIRPEGAEEEIVLGIDFTVASTDIDLAKKLRRNRTQPVRKTKYATRAVPSNLEYLPVVLAMDRRRAERTSIHEAKRQTAEAHSGGEGVVKQSSIETELYHDDAVFRYAIVEEALAQLRVQEETLIDRNADAKTLETYNSAITYFEKILAERKNLQAAAGLETNLDAGVYRVADESFIRSAPELAGDAAASRVA